MSLELQKLHGLFLVDKPEGISSFGVIDLFKRELVKVTGLRARDLPKMGHGGTLDPFATGLLIVCFGDGVKLSRYFLDSEKGYSATLRFGETTLSGDFTNEVTERTNHLPGSRDEIQKAADTFCQKPYDQIPPMHSAKKVDGKPLYELARKGIEIDRKPKRCQIHSLHVLSWDPGARSAEITCEVSSGTYIRTLAQDLAKSLGSLAGLIALRRTRSGSFRVEQATPPQDFLSLRGFIPMNAALPHLAPVELNAEEVRALREGRQQVLSLLPTPDSPPATPERRALRFQGELIGIAVQIDGHWELERILSRGA